MAAVPYDFACNEQAGFLTNPNAHQRYGFVTSVGGFGMPTPFSRDLQVQVAFNPGAPPTFSGLQYKNFLQSATPGGGSSAGGIGSASVVGVLEKFTWAGGAGDPITLEFYVSQTNATRLKALQQQTLGTAAVTSLAWWIADYDQETKKWYEQSYPLGGSVNATLQSKTNPALNVDLTSVTAKPGSSVGVYRVSLTVGPAADVSYSLQFANSSNVRAIRSWGLTVGGLSARA